MRVGIAIHGTGGMDAFLDRARFIERAGASTIWMAQSPGQRPRPVLRRRVHYELFDFDALVALAILGRELPHIEMGTAVLPIYPRHPLAMAREALTAQAACDGRFVLGVGVSHKLIVENMFGYTYDHPVLQMREYLMALEPALREQRVEYRGATVRAWGSFAISDVARVPVLVGALGPRMLNVAGSCADGAITFLAGPALTEESVVPAVSKAAADAGRPSPRIVAGLPVGLSNDRDALCALTDRVFRNYAQQPVYRAILERGGVERPSDVALLGDEETLVNGIRRLAGAGATDVCALLVGDEAGCRRTAEFLGRFASGR